MTVGTFNQPNNTLMTGTQYLAAIDAAVSVLAGVAAQFAPHQQVSANMTVLVDAGSVLNGTTLTSQAQQSTGVITANATYPRIDRVVIDAITGAVSVITGVAANSPSAPALTTGKYPVAQIALTANAATITNSMIVDERNFKQNTATNLSGGTANVVGGLSRNGVLVFSDTAPTIVSGFGNSPSIVGTNGSLAFRINVGTGGISGSGVIGMPTAPNGWLCNASYINPSVANMYMSYSVSNSSISLSNIQVSTGNAIAFPSGQNISLICFPY